jgi:hypothetical protein
MLLLTATLACPLCNPSLTPSEIDLMGTHYTEVDSKVLEKLIEDYKNVRLSLMYETSSDFKLSRKRIQETVDEYRLWLDLHPDPNPIYLLKEEE